MNEDQLSTCYLVTEAMIDELTDYLLGQDLYRQLVVQTPHGTRQPKMTLGALLENLQYLGWFQEKLKAGQRRNLTGFEEKVDSARSAFRLQWQELLQREVKALVGSWRWYLEDAARDAQAREDYAAEVHHRTRLDLILEELSGDPAIAEERRELGKLDSRLRTMLHSSSYLGPRGLKQHYSPDRAWWLYGSLSQEA